jgi:multidrug efflux system membrane fusion protein
MSDCPGETIRPRKPFSLRQAIGASGAVSCLSLFLAGSPARAQSAAPVNVSVATAALKDVPVVQRGIGTAQAYNTVLIRSRVDGTLEKINFIEGQEVHAGDVLAVIDKRPYQAVLDQALGKKAADEAQLANAKLDLQRYANLAQSEFASRQSVDTQKALVLQLTANLQADAAAITAAQLNLTFCDIQSPINGIVGIRAVDIGNLIHATDATGIVTVTQIKPISVIFTLPQEALPDVQDALRQGPLKVVAFTSNETRALGEGQLLTPDNTIDVSSGTIRMKATFPNADNRLWPGEFVNVHLIVSTLRDVVTLPSAAVQRGPDGLYVYKVQPDQTVTRQPVTLTQDDSGVAVIAAGVSKDEVVVTAGQSRLTEGVKVAAAPSPDGQATKAGG